MLTTQDIAKMTQLFTTKAELKQEIEKVREEMATKQDMNKVMTMLDAVMSELKDMCQEQTFHVQDHRNIKEEVDELKERVTKIEKHIPV